MYCRPDRVPHHDIRGVKLWRGRLGSQPEPQKHHSVLNETCNCPASAASQWWVREPSWLRFDKSHGGA
eukprot:1896832-Rhodomonas_salina.1